jgi:dTDP-4-amino-4,6-dideoxygalactose transaminase
MVSAEFASVIRLARPDITDGDITAVVEVLKTGHLVQGKTVREFEQRIAEHSDGGEVVAVCNGTAALHLALLSLGIGAGHRVGVAAFSWPATANAVVVAGAQPVFIDIEPDTMGMDPAALEKTLRNDRLDALIPVHAFGQMANMGAIMAIADDRGIPVIEDAACALGATLEGKAAGSWGTLGCFSFHPRKAATTGEGGAVRTMDGSLARKLRVLRNHGLDPDVSSPDFIEAGFNLRLTEFQAALGVSQLQRYRDMVVVRRRLAKRYEVLLADLPLTLPNVLDIGSHIFQSYVVRLDRALAPRRAVILSSLREQGVEANVGTHHMPLITYYRREFGFAAGDFPVTDEVAASAIALPMHSYLTEVEQETVARALGGAIVA